jgi:hypothetical protein
LNHESDDSIVPEPTGAGTQAEPDPLAGVSAAAVFLAHDEEPLDETETANAKAVPRKVAILITHGMGQQVRFETLDMLARLVVNAAVDPSDNASRRVVTRLVTLPGGKILGRAEFTLERSDKVRFSVHVYEAYWAPLTEGLVHLRDVATFLARAGVAGAMGSRHLRFYRFVLNAWRRYPIPAKAKRIFTLGLLAFGALAVLNAAVVAGASATLFGQGMWPPRDLLHAWTIDFLIFVIPAGVTGFFLWWMSVVERQQRRAMAPTSRLRRGRLTTPVTVLLLVTIVALIVAGGLAGLHLVGVLRAPFAALGDRLGRYVVVAIWALVLLISAVIRWYLVEYVGDVAAYLSAPGLDRFYRLRKDIQTTVGEVGRAVFGNRTYEQVIVVGHSLGAVVNYDMLNALINEDLIASSSQAGSKASRDVVERTRAFITFGSPLDKTAFVFRTLGGTSHTIREALAAAVQPLIVSEAWRPRRWVNIWSHLDYISSPLDYYDLPGASTSIPEKPLGQLLREIAGAPAYRVCNAEDPDAGIPVLAHVQYWTNPLLANCIVWAIFGQL